MARVHLLAARGGGALRSGRSLWVLLIGLASLMTASAEAQDIERDPIRYSAATPRNVVSQLQERVDQGATKLEYEPKHGYLKSVLQALDIPESSQVLVYSKTSLQRERISPRTPRAIYFNDEVMVGYCNRGRVMEISTADEAIGTAFYTIDQVAGEKPVIERQTESCLLCHSSSANQGFPGHLVRSLYVDRQGNPQLASGSFRTDHTSPLAERWGGWYVTGSTGTARHMGNAMVTADPEAMITPQTLHVQSLTAKFDTSAYLSAYSDIVALLVFNHQIRMQDLIIRIGWEARAAAREKAAPLLHDLAREFVDSLLFIDEAPLAGKIQGSSGFAERFAAEGPRDSRGRSLRQFDLEKRLMRYPCSYLIYSPAFDALPAAAKTAIFERMWAVLSGAEKDAKYRRLSTADRANVLGILRETKRDLPGYFRVPTP
jgi:hypothetical protein